MSLFVLELAAYIVLVALAIELIARAIKYYVLDEKKRWFIVSYETGSGDRGLMNISTPKTGFLNHSEIEAVIGEPATLVNIYECKNKKEIELWKLDRTSEITVDGKTFAPKTEEEKSDDIGLTDDELIQHVMDKEEKPNY